MKRRAFSLVELLLAVFILGIGIIGISALFPAGIAQQRQAADDTMGPIVADNAMALLRLKLKPEWFGSYSDFGQSDFVVPPNGTQVFTLGAGLPGDWRWKRPGFIFMDIGNTPNINENGAIDIFSALFTSKTDGGTVGTGLTLSKSATESPDGGTSGALLYGIPFNRSAFDPLYSPFNPTPTHVDTPPLVLISQEERSYPQGGSSGSGSKRPLYYWDCMFRKFEGRIQVAVFVYRVVSAGSPRGYTVAQGAIPIVPTTPPLPILVMPTVSWKYGGADGNPATAIDNAQIPGTASSGTAAVDLPPDQSWQYPNQWIVDERNTVHRVMGGRRTTKDGPVTFTRPIPAHPPIPSLFGFDQTGAALADPGIRAAWFIPGIDAQGYSLVPVYATVQEL